uniref:EF-hand domain-containing protein n=1 Tax=Zooxanthella nutricula TaxID=1333877 RepID=A0A7S2L9M9_9DINO
MRKIGFNGSAIETWRRLSRGRAQVTLDDLDPHATEILTEFYSTFVEEIGRLDMLVEESDAMRIGKTRFAEKCAPLRKKKPRNGNMQPVDIEGVFRVLQTVPGCLTEEDLSWLKSFCARGASEKELAPKAEKSEVVAEELGLSRQEKLAMKSRKRAVQDFKVLLQHRFGSLPRAWRVLLDREGNGAITGEDLEAVVEALEFPAEAMDLWDQLVGSEADAMTLKEFCPEAVAAQKAFKVQCAETYGSLKVAFERLQAEDKPLVTKEEFRIFCIGIKFDRNFRLLFDFLDTRHNGYITLNSLDDKAATAAFGSSAKVKALAAYRSLESVPQKAVRVDIATRAADQCAEHQKDPEEYRSHLKELVKLMTARWQTPVRAWGAVFDRNGKGKISQEEFFVGCSVVGYTASKTKLWEELNLKSKQKVRLRDIAPEVMQSCAQFKSLSSKHLGRIITGLEGAVSEDVKKKEGAIVKADEFKSICKEIGYTGRPKALLRHFDPEGKGYITSKALKFFHEEKKEDKAMSALIRKGQEYKRDKWRERLAEVRVAPGEELRARQDVLLATGREKRAQQVELEKGRRHLLVVLARRFGSLAKAWKLALNPSDVDELDIARFLDGLKRAGVLGAVPQQEEVDRLTRLHAYLISGDEEASGLKLQHLDRRIGEQLEELKDRCAERYGTVWQAFDAFDPEATGKITRKDFGHLCHEVKMTDGVYRLMHFLDPESEHEIGLDDIDKEAAEDAREAHKERQEEARNKELRDERLKRTHMTTVPRSLGSSVGAEARRLERKAGESQRALRELKSRLTRKHGNLVKAWREVLDPNSKGSISFNAFERGCLRAHPEADPGLVWQAFWLGEGGDDAKTSLGGKRSSAGHRLTLEMFEPAVLQDLADIRAKVVERYGSFLNAFVAVDPATVGTIDLDTFLAFCYECQFRRNDRRLFAYLSVDGERLPLAELDREAAQALQLKRDIRKQKEKTKKRSDTSDDEKDSEGGDEAGEDDEEDEEEGDAAPQGAQKDPAEAFRELCCRRFGNLVRAWRAIDPQGVAVVRKQEFIRSVSATGYAGGQSNLWAALVGDAAGFSLKDFDPDGFEQLVRFRLAVSNNFSGLELAFQEHGHSTKRYALDEFCKLCKTCGVPKPWPALFEMLAAKDAVGWTEVRFMEDWDYTAGAEQPVRQEPRERPPNPRILPPRAVGQGPLASSMRPRKVVLSKANSLPALFTPLRAQWNDRHQILTHLGNKEEQALHQMVHVQTQEAERCKRRVARKMAEMSTAQWIAQSGLALDDDVSDSEDGD